MPLKFLKVIAQENLPGHLFDPVAATPKQKGVGEGFRGRRHSGNL